MGTPMCYLSYTDMFVIALYPNPKQQPHVLVADLRTFDSFECYSCSIIICEQRSLFFLLKMVNID